MFPNHFFACLAIFSTMAISGASRAGDSSFLILKGHKGPVYSAEMTADGKKILTCGADGTARLWDAETGKELLAFVHPSPKYSPLGGNGMALARLSPDGKRVLTVIANCYDHDVNYNGRCASFISGEDLRTKDAARLWDGDTGKMIAEWSNDQAELRQVACVSPFGPSFSPDGKLVATMFGSEIDLAVRVHDATTGKERFRLEGHKHPVVEVAFSPDGKKIATASLDQTAKVWDAASGKCLKTYKGHTSGVIGVAFSSDGERLFTHCAGHTHRFELKPNSSSGGSSTVNDAIGRVWDVTTEKETIALVWGTLPGTPTVRQIGFGSLSFRFETKGVEDKLGFVRTARFTPDGNGILTAGVIGSVSGNEDRHPTIWDVTTGKRLVSFKGEKFENVLSATPSPDGKLIATAGMEGVIRVWDAKKGSVVNTLRGHTKQIRTVIFSPDGKRLVSSSDDGTVRIWSVPSKR